MNYLKSNIIPLSFLRSSFISRPKFDLSGSKTNELFEYGELDPRFGHPGSIFGAVGIVLSRLDLCCPVMIFACYLFEEMFFRLNFLSIPAEN